MFNGYAGQLEKENESEGGYNKFTLRRVMRGRRTYAGPGKLKSKITFARYIGILLKTSTVLKFNHKPAKLKSFRTEAQNKIRSKPAKLKSFRTEAENKIRSKPAKLKSFRAEAENKEKHLIQEANNTIQKVQQKERE